MLHLVDLYNGMAGDMPHDLEGVSVPDDRNHGQDSDVKGLGTKFNSSSESISSRPSNVDIRKFSEKA